MSWLAVVQLKRLSRCLVVVVMSVLFIPQTGSAQTISCDESLKPIPGPLGYKARGGRCEGFYDQAYGSSAELVSLTASRVSFPPNIQDRIVLELPHLETLGERQVLLRVSAKVPETYYRLDAKRALGSRFVWPVSTVLVDAKLEPEDLGYLAWTNDERGQIFVPLTVDARVAGRGSFDSVFAVIRLSLPTETLYWKHYGSKVGDENPSPGWKRVDLKDDNRTGFVTIRVPVLRREFTQVNVRAKLVDRDTMDELDFRFANSYHHAR